MSSLREHIRAELSGPAIPLMAFGVALNLTVGQITAALKLPVYLDSIGTVLTAVLCGPWAAALTGSMANLLASAFGSPAMLFFIPVVIVIGMFTAFLARLGWFRSLPLVILGGILQGIIAAIVSAPISSSLFGGSMMAGTDLLVVLFRSLGNDVFLSTLFQGLASDPLDKVITYVLVFLTIRNLPLRIRSRFSGASHLQSS
jgi:energy-coupling factor transport system substrate-specific component